MEDWEKQAIIGLHLKNSLERYRRLTLMMLDADIVAVSPTSVWRVLVHAGMLSKRNDKPSKKGTGFKQLLAGMSTGISMFRASTSAGRSTNVRIATTRAQSE